MNLLKPFAFTLALTCLSFVSFGQLQDTSSMFKDSSSVYFFQRSIDSLSLKAWHHIDTNLKQIHQYDPVFQKGNYYANLGNIGLASQNLIFSGNAESGFNYGSSAFYPYEYLNRNIKYYIHKKHYSEIFYIMGGKKEQTFRVIHSQKVLPNLTIGLNLRFINSPGIYYQQKSDDKNFYATLQYYTKNERYGIIANYLHDKFVVEENGGIKSDSIFENNIETERNLYEINLDKNVKAQNLAKRGEFYFNQYFNISPPPKNTNDTLDSIPAKRNWFHLGRISHSMKWTRDKHIYSDEDPLNDFYAGYDPIVDSTFTYDSTQVLRLENELKWSNLSYNEKPDDKTIYMAFGAKHQYIEISDTLNYNKYDQIIPFGSLSFYLFKSFRLNLDGSFCIGGYNANDYQLKANVDQYLGTASKNLGMLRLNANVANQEAPWFYNQYYGNYFRWDNDFKKIKSIDLHAEYNYKKTSLSASYHLYNNYIRLGDSIRPEQYGEALSVLILHLFKIFKLGDFSFENDLYFQKSSNSDILNLSSFVGHASVFYTKPLFKNAAIVQPGFDLFYFSEYTADAYMPALKSFYSQDNKTVGNYLYIDVFLNVNIKRARLFLKYQHVNSGLMGYNFFMVPSYPIADGRIKFGISWKFYD